MSRSTASRKQIEAAADALALNFPRRSVSRLSAAHRRASPRIATPVRPGHADQFIPLRRTSRRTTSQPYASLRIAAQHFAALSNAPLTP